MAARRKLVFPKEFTRVRVECAEAIILRGGNEHYAACRDKRAAEHY